MKQDMILTWKEDEDGVPYVRIDGLVPGEPVMAIRALDVATPLTARKHAEYMGMMGGPCVRGSKEADERMGYFRFSESAEEWRFKHFKSLGAEQDAGVVATISDLPRGEAVSCDTEAQPCPCTPGGGGVRYNVVWQDTYGERHEPGSMSAGELLRWLEDQPDELRHLAVTVA